MSISRAPGVGDEGSQSQALQRGPPGTQGKSGSSRRPLPEFQPKDERSSSSVIHSQAPAGVTSVSLFHEEAELPGSFPCSESHLSWLSGRFLSIKPFPSDMCNNSSKKQTLATGTQLVGSKSTNNLKENSPDPLLPKLWVMNCLTDRQKQGIKGGSPLSV